MIAELDRSCTDRAAASRRELQRARQRSHILVAARDVFFRDGFMGANLDDVARRAGVAKGTLYRYFDNKAELYVAVLWEKGEIFERKLEETLSSPGSPRDQVRRIGRFYLRHWTEHHAYFQIFWALENESVIGGLPAEVVEQVTKFWERCLQRLAAVLERGIREGDFAPHDPWEVANVLWTLANGIIQSEYAEPRRTLRRVPLETFFENAVDLVLDGLAPRAIRS